jgi:hypothetical protein
MLGLIMDPWLSSPSDEDEHGDGVYIPVSKRQKRIDGVAQSGVLQICQRNVSCRQVITDSKSNAATFVRADDVLAGLARIRDACAQFLEQGIRHPSEKIHSIPSEAVDEFLRV